MKSILLDILWDLNTLVGEHMRRLGFGEYKYNLGGPDAKVFREAFNSRNSECPNLPGDDATKKIAAATWDKISPPKDPKMVPETVAAINQLKIDAYAIIERHAPAASCRDFNRERFCAWFCALAKQEREAVDKLKRSREHLPAENAQILSRSYNKANIYGDDWKEKKGIVELSMVAVSGGVFRKERLVWQGRDGDFPDDTQIAQESRADMEHRIDEEVGNKDIEEPWDDALRSIRVFFGREQWFADRERTGIVPIERHEASFRFWTKYLAGLKKRMKQLKVIELYQINNPGFYAHMKIYEGQNSGHIVGCNLFDAEDFPHAFEIWWPPRTDKPAAFLVVQRAIERLGSAHKRHKIVF